MKGTFLYQFNDGRWLNYYNGDFYVGDECISDSHIPWYKKLLTRNRIIARILRDTPRCIESLDENRFIICHQCKVWLLDLKEKTFSVLQISRKGFSTPLNLCSDGQYVYWGEYGDNSQRDSVNIYRLSNDLTIDVIYKFPKNSIRHIHNIIWDKDSRHFFILTGDLERASGIYIASKDWSDIKPVALGQQKFRAVIGCPYKQGLIYATDSVSEDNYIYLLQNGKVKTLCAFPGSCIYGTQTKDYYVFASTVEPPEGRGFLNMFTYKLGNGIKDRYSHLITVNKDNLEVKEILKVKKDVWPMKLFQYGSITFPKGQENNNELWYNIVACKGDGQTKRINLDSMV